MLRYLFRNFRHHLMLDGAVKGTQNHLSKLQNLIFIGRFGTNADNGNIEQSICQEKEAAYIVPYDVQSEFAKSYSKNLIDCLKSRLQLSKSEIEKVINDESVDRIYKGQNLLRILEKLLSHGVNKNSIIELPWLLTLDYSTLDEKFELLEQLKPKDINDVAALLRLSKDRLQKILAILRSEKEFIPEGNRIYYISEKLKVDPAIISKYTCKRLFILEMPFSMLKENLENMLSYNVSSANILRDLWAFRYKPLSIKSRFERAKSAKKRKIMPWMARCTEPILQRSIKLTQDELKILNGKSSIVEYIAERLNFDVDFTKTVMEKHAPVFNVRATKIKEVLDFLIDEAKFTPHEIAQNPRILCHGLETTKRRYEELKSMNCRPSSLVILCRSKREYQKFVDHWLDLEEKQKMYEEKQKEITNKCLS